MFEYFFHCFQYPENFIKGCWDFLVIFLKIWFFKYEFPFSVFRSFIRRVCWRLAKKKDVSCSTRHILLWIILIMWFMIFQPVIDTLTNHLLKESYITLNHCFYILKSFLSHEFIYAFFSTNVFACPASSLVLGVIWSALLSSDSVSSLFTAITSSLTALADQRCLRLLTFYRILL